MVEARRHRWPQGPYDGHGRGGFLFDLAPHLVDQALLFFGPVETVHADVEARRPNAVNDDDVLVSLRHTNGVRTRLWMSSLAAHDRPRFLLRGARGSHRTFGLDPQEAQLEAGLRPGDADFGVEPAEPRGEIADGAAPRPVPTRPGSYETCYSELATALRTGTPPPVDPRDSVAVLRVIEAARHAASADAGPALRRFGATALVVGGSMTGSWDLIGPALAGGWPPACRSRPAAAGLIGAARYAAEVPEDNDASIL
ncbi:Gfo/Idh/MocA family oxidoreductase [Streptomyces sp. NPDC087422]|uniref:Gfo/Idh/MocA family oxidoreductase n=1 Tax=Streptomyces sp. NPDC087422 TaxID=3365786 RepID=UPI003821E92D